MRQAIDTNDREFLQQLQQLGCGTIHDLCAQLSVTATAVRQRLQKLSLEGLVDRQPVRGGRGRPHFEYSVSQRGRRLLGENYSDLALILWQELHRIEDEQVRRSVLDRVRDSLVQRFGSQVNPQLPLPERMAQLSRAMVERGFDVVSPATDELPILQESSCPYLELAETDRAICELEQEVFEQVLQTSLERRTGCLDGHSCCEFVPASTASDPS